MNPECPVCGGSNMKVVERWTVRTTTEYTKFAFKEEPSPAGPILRAAYVDDNSAVVKRSDRERSLVAMCMRCNYGLMLDTLDFVDWLESDPIPLEEQMEMFPNPEVEGEFPAAGDGDTITVRSRWKFGDS